MGTIILIRTYQSISLLIFYHFCRVLISTVNKSTDALPLVFFNNCHGFADKDFNNGMYNIIPSEARFPFGSWLHLRGFPIF